MTLKSQFSFEPSLKRGAALMELFWGKNLQKQRAVPETQYAVALGRVGRRILVDYRLHQHEPNSLRNAKTRLRKLQKVYRVFREMMKQ
jgi:hypothetical protein